MNSTATNVWRLIKLNAFNEFFSINYNLESFITSTNKLILLEKCAARFAKFSEGEKSTYLQDLSKHLRGAVPLANLGRH
jgi:hypothetical protein